MPRNTATSKIGNGVISLLWQLRCHCNPDHNKFSSLSNTTALLIFPNLCLWRHSLRSNLGGIDPDKLYRATLKQPFHDTRFWYHALIGLFMLTDSSCCWQYRALSISCSYNLGKDFLKHRFWARNTNFFARLFAYPTAPGRAKNIPVICCEKKKKHSKYEAFLTLFCDKLRSHLQSDWPINRRSKGTVL